MSTRSRLRLFLVPLLAVSLASLAREPETLEQLKARAASLSGKDAVSVCMEIARRQLDAADKHFAAGEMDQGLAALQEVGTYGQKAGEAARASGKKLKQTEIALRKMSERLRDVKRNLNFEDRAPVQAVIDRLEQLRSELLARMFSKG